MKPQTTAVLSVLRDHPEGITALEGLEYAGTFRLAARIDELRKAGYDIASEYVTTPSRKRIVRYVLTEQLRMAL